MKTIWKNWKGMLLTWPLIIPLGVMAQATISTYAGGYIGDGSDATKAFLLHPTGVAFDAGNLYIAEYYNNRIRKVDISTGIITTVAGGYAEWADGGAADKSRLFSPQAVAFDRSGNMYVAEFNTVRKVDAVTGIITTIAGAYLPATPPSADDGVTATSYILSDIKAITFDHDDNLYIADASDKVMKVDALTRIITTFAGNYEAGETDGVLATNSRLPSLRDIKFDAFGNLYISSGNKIRKVDAITGIITTVLISEAPSGIAFDGIGNLYFTDNNLVRKVDISSGILTTVAGVPPAWDGSFDGDGGVAISAHLNYPRGIVFDGSDNLYIADEYNGRIRKIDSSSGIITTIAGCDIIGDGDLATKACFVAPEGMTADKEGNLFISDWDGRIRKVEKKTGKISTVGSGKDGYIAFDVAGHLYTSDRYSQIIKVGLAGDPNIRIAGFWAGYSGDGGPAIDAQLNRPEGIAIDLSGDVYIADSWNNRIRKIDLSSGIITTVAGTGVPGFSGDGGLAINANLNYPSAVAFDGANNYLFIADQANRRVRKVDLVTGIITTVVGNGTYEYNGDGGAAINASLKVIKSIAVDQYGNLYVADPLSHVIRFINKNTGIISTIAGNGIMDYTGDGGLSKDASLSYPASLVLDEIGDLFFVDEQVVRKISKAIPDVKITSSDYGIVGETIELVLNTNSTGQVMFSVESSTGSGTITEDNKLKLTTAGSFTITAKVSADANYYATSVTQTIIAGKGDQSITLESIEDKTLGDTPFSLSGNADSGLPLVYTDSPSDKVAINGNQVTLIEAGRVTITASQDGNSNYNPAANVSKSFCINPAKPIISASATLPDPEFPILTSSSDTGNQWYLNGIILSGETNNTIVVTQPGTYTARVSVDDCQSVSSNAEILVVTGVESKSELNVSLSPNPSSNSITLQAEQNMLEGKEVTVFIIDFSGMELGHGGSEMFNRELNISNYPPGIFLVKVTVGKEKSVLKFIKK